MHVYIVVCVCEDDLGGRSCCTPASKTSCVVCAEACLFGSRQLPLFFFCSSCVLRMWWWWWWWYLLLKMMAISYDACALKIHHHSLQCASSCVLTKADGPFCLRMHVWVLYSVDIWLHCKEHPPSFSGCIALCQVYRRDVPQRCTQR